MRCPSEKTLVDRFAQLWKHDSKDPEKQAKLVRAVCKAVDNPSSLQRLLDSSFPKTAKVVAQMGISPYSSFGTRYAIVQRALNEVLGGHGIEEKGNTLYVNVGDQDAQTFIFGSDYVTVGDYEDVCRRRGRV